MVSGKAIAKKLAESSTVQVFTGTFQGVATDGRATVDGGGETALLAYNTGEYTPLVGDVVRLLRVDDVVVLLGIATQKEQEGAITAVGVDPVDGVTVVTVLTASGITYTGLRVFDSVTTPTVGDVVVINWPAGGIIVGRYVPAATSAPLPPPGGGSTSGSAEFRAVDSGSFLAGGSWWTNDVIYSDHNRGAWFPGTAIHDTIPSGANFTRIQIYLPLYSAYGGSTTLGTHTYSTKPGGTIAISNNWDTNGTGWVDVDPSMFASWQAVLLAGGGVGTATTLHGNNKYSGTNSDALSGALRIDWSS